ncbi:MAG: hypothetical protein RL141_896, partial [Candidatus Parcubacteria bacterium]
KVVSEKTYTDAVDTVLDYYTKSRHLAKTEVPGLRRYLQGRWTEVRKELKPSAPKKTRR